MKNLSILALAGLILASCVGAGSKHSSSLNQQLQNAQNGNRKSQYEMAIRYTNGTGVKKNDKKAVEWLTKASGQGHHQSEYLLGVAYATGRGIKINQKEAVRLYTLAARSGHAHSQYQLGDAFANGRGAPKDILQASRWYEKAARQKHSKALFNIGVMRAAGLDGPKDMEQAWVWLQLSALNGYGPARKVRDKVETRLTSSSLTRAQKLVKSWQWKQTTSFDDVPTIRYTQRGLDKLGFKPGKDNGIANTSTNAAVIAYRNSQGLPSTAVIDAELVASLNKSLAGGN
jgi:TPR repeat protein